MKVCANCFNDSELKQYIISNSEEKGECIFCSESKHSDLIEINELLDFFADFIEIFKYDPNGIPLVNLIQDDWNLFSSESACYEILFEILPLSNSTINDPVLKVSYIDDIIECTSYWETLKEDIKWNTRFLTNIDRLDELGWHLLFKQSINLSKSEPLFRARLHYNGNQKTFDSRVMGCPDKNQASAGRANPQGIPYLYLSKKIETNLYEVRATFLDEVSIGTFKIKPDSEVILIDFTESVSAFLNVDHIIEYTKSMLLKRFISADLSRPIRRYDSELEYIPTQFICEYIRYFSDNADGILFNSSLHIGGKNVVLFEQDKVECISVEQHRVTKVEIESIKL